VINNLLYVDIHSHNISDDGEVFTLNNVLVNEQKKLDLTKYYSVGIHPWYVNEFNVDGYFKRFKEYFTNKNILAVGEIGLDKLKQKFDIQTQLFEKQLNYANTNKFPVIIHCVKAYNELLLILENNKIETPLIFHRYGGNAQLTEQLLQGNNYFSFGQSLFNENPKTNRIFKRLANNRIFLETDDANISIIEVYKRAASLRGTSVTELKKVIYNNFISIFDII